MCRFTNFGSTVNDIFGYLTARFITDFNPARCSEPYSSRIIPLALFGIKSTINR
jgi:hypothetical protein